MKFLMVCLMSLMLSVQANTAQQSTVAGQVRLADGRPVAGAQVTLFDLANLHRGAVARAMTDEAGYFALPLASLGGPALPQGFALGANYPNPFNPSTVIPYQLPTATQVRLDVFNVLGQHVATLVDTEQQAGFHAAKWDATNAAGQAMAAGVYFYRLTVGGGQQTQRMVLIDGQAGIGAAASSIAATMSADAAEREYGLVVSGEGLTTYADAAFGVQVGMAAVELVVDAAPLTIDQVLAGEVLGDVNNDGQVVVEDAMLVGMYSSNPSVAMPNNGSILLGDVNGDGEVNETDVLVIMRYISNPLDGALPAGIGQRIASGKRAADDSGVSRLTGQDSGKAIAPAWSPDGQHIAFESTRDGNKEIYVMGLDGSNPRRLTDHEAGDFSPAWSPDGQHIAFSSNRDGDDNNFEIYVMGLDGSNPRRLTDHEAGDFSPAWSPDGQHIAFSSNRDGDDNNFEIYVMGLDGSNPRRLTSNSAGDRSPAWSPDGQHIAFSSNRDGGDDDIYVMEMDGSGVSRLTDASGGDFSPAWSPDGRRIVFSSSRDGNREIYMMGLDGSNPRRLTNHSAYDGSPAWSPDGQYIALSSDRDGDVGVYVMDVDGSDTTGTGEEEGADDTTGTGEEEGADDTTGTEEEGADDTTRTEEEGADDTTRTEERGVSFVGELEGEGADDTTGTEEEGADDTTRTEEEGADDTTRTEERGVSFVGELEGEGADDTTGTEGEGADDTTRTEEEGADDTTETEEEGADDTTRTEEEGAEGEHTFPLLLGGASMEFVWIPAGTFQMGSPDTEKGRSWDEGPVHEVKISEGFYLGKYEITQGEWEAVMGDNPSYYSTGDAGDDRRPVESVSWDDLQRFISHLNDAAGDSLYRLPSEAEWEYACRAGSSTPWSFGNSESELTKYAWYEGNNSPEGTKQVGQKEPNAWGLHDMHGNVWEWVQDWYDENYYNNSPQLDPRGPTSGLGRVRRGGYFDHVPAGVRSAYRYLYAPDERSSMIGARLLRMPGD